MTRRPGLFINTKTVGWLFEARPLPGANAHIVSSLENLLRTKLPRNVPVTINLVSSKLVGDDIEYGLREFSWSGKQAEKLMPSPGPTISGRQKHSFLFLPEWIYR
ncbi:conjugal transfer ATP-binding protein TraC [Raoultella planticola]|nr:conjugal transfer ATP-binding protein TraC [Raoultella planticola]